MAKAKSATAHLVSRFASECKKEPIAACALVFSMIALFVALGGLYVSRQAHLQTLVQYQEERDIILTAQPGKLEDGLTIKPTDSGFHLLGGRVQFPSVIHKDPVQIQQSGEVWGMGTIASQINGHYFRRFPPQKGFAIVIESGIPILVSSDYTIKGRRYFDLSLYELRYESVIGDEKATPLDPRINGFTFVRRMKPSDTIPSDLLDVSFELGIRWMDLK